MNDLNLKDGKRFDAATEYLYQKRIAELEEENAALEARCEKLEKAIKEQGRWLKGCADAAFSNMEGADEKEFLYWEKWGSDCVDQMNKIKKYLAKGEENK